MRMTSRGQVTVPPALRKRFGLTPHTEVIFEDVNGKLVLHAAHNHSLGTQRRLHRILGRATADMGLDEILRLTRGE